MLSFRSKIFIPFALLIFVATVVILFVVNVQVRSKLKNVLQHDLIGVHKVLLEYETARLELLQTKGALLAEEPRLKAALDTRDPATVSQEAIKFISMVETDFMILTDPQGRLLASLGDFQLSRSDVSTLPSIQRALQFDQQISLFGRKDEIFQIISSPSTLMDRSGNSYLLGTISIGLRINTKFLDHLQALTDCSILFFDRKTETLLVSSQLQNRELETRAIIQTFYDLSQQLETVQELDIADEKYLYLPTSLFQDSDGFHLVLLKSLDSALQPILGPTQRILLLIGFIALLSTLFLSYVMARNVSSPVTKLAQAFHRVSQGDLDRPIELRRRDELGRLARDFDDMRIALKNNIENLEKTYARLMVSEKLATTGKLLAHLSHELNNPIHNIRSALEAALKKMPESKDRTLVDVAFKEVQRLERLVRQTLNFYRPSADDRVKVNVNTILDDLIEISRDSLQKRSITVVEQLQDDLKPVVANRDQLKQVFLNLVLNARDAMPSGGELLVQTRNLEDNIKIVIQDTGHGIPDEFRDKIFDAFFTTKTKVSGVGLGLSVSYEIINQHGGDIAIDPSYESGARFVIQLPANSEG